VEPPTGAGLREAPGRYAAILHPLLAACLPRIVAAVVVMREWMAIALGAGRQGWSEEFLRPVWLQVFWRICPGLDSAPAFKQESPITRPGASSGKKVAGTEMPTPKAAAFKKVCRIEGDPVEDTAGPNRKPDVIPFKAHEAATLIGSPRRYFACC